MPSGTMPRTTFPMSERMQMNVAYLAAKARVKVP